MGRIGNRSKQEPMFDAHISHPLPSAFAAGTIVRADARLPSWRANMANHAAPFPIHRGVLR